MVTISPRRGAGFVDRGLAALALFEEATAAWREFGAADWRFAAVLVGRDGGAEFRSDEPVRIDAMFLRRL